jgi:hypothetical protein
MALTIGCKLPSGLHLDHEGKRVTLNGSNSSNIIGGYGLTHNVDQAFWEAWKKAHADFEPLKQGLIFAQEKEANARAEASDKQALENGFEGIDPNKPGKKVKGIEKADV